MKQPGLNRKLMLQTADRVADGAGGFSESWVALGTLWGEVRARTGRERNGGAVAVSTAGYRITVRSAPRGSLARPVAGQRFRDGTQMFTIRAVSEADALGRYLMCTCDEEVAT